MPPAEVAAPFDPNQKIAGQISVADALKAQVKEGDVMFVVARTDDGSEKGGMILGVKRLVCGAFPLDFVVDGRDSMMVGSKFEGKVLLTARVDKDGDAMTKLPGDVIGVAHLSIPAVGVKLSLDTVTK